MNLQEQIEAFADQWGPYRNTKYKLFVEELRALLEAYGKAALQHESLPDIEHGHGEPL